MTSIIIFSSNKSIKIITTTLKEKLESDIAEIKDLNKKQGFLKNIRNNINALRSQETSIEPEIIDMTGYDLIILGCPSTLGGISPAIKTFISKNNFKDKNIIIFTTTNTGQGYDVLKQIKEKLEDQEAHLVNSFIMRVNHKSEEELKINTIKLIKQLDIDLYS